MTALPLLLLVGNLATKPDVLLAGRNALEPLLRSGWNIDGPANIDRTIRQCEPAIVEAKNPQQIWETNFALVQRLRDNRVDIPRQNALLLSMIDEVDWSHERAVQVTLVFLDFQLFDLQGHELRNLELAEAVASQLIDQCSGPDRFASRLQAQVKFLRVLRERQGPRSTLVHGKAFCLSASDSICRGVIDSKRNRSPASRIANGTAIDNLGLYVAQLVQFMEPAERDQAVRDLRLFMHHCRLEHRMANALNVGLAEFRPANHLEL